MRDFGKVYNGGDDVYIKSFHTGRFERGVFMDMEVIYSRKYLCSCYMEGHEVKTVRVMEQASFKDIPVDYKAVYFYCDAAEELYMDEDQISQNTAAIRDAYRKSQGLLTSREIIAIRRKYGISQKDLCTLLGWGGKAITRYEGYQIQDKAHDTILKKSRA